MRSIHKTLRTTAGLLGLAALLAAAPAAADQVILDDLIVDGSICVGLDCVNGESFGFDTLRLKENNLRIKFHDTSTSASFPRNHWQITANDSSNGGAEKFSIDDITGGRTPFTIEASAPSNSLFVDDGGRIGLGTATPVVEVHIVDGDTPTVRLEQDGSSGFQPQTWDVAGNETNFFIRDVTNGSRLSLRIRPQAPSNSIYVNTNGDVGMGTSSPQSALHIEDTGANNQVVRLVANASRSWLFGLTNTADEFNVNGLTNAGVEFSVKANGDVEIPAGATYMGSDRNRKSEIVPQDGREILDKLAALPISTWAFSHNEGHRHLGPMAQDFYAAFGLGKDDVTIAPMDATGVAMAAVQGLHQVVLEKDQALEALRLENAELAARLAALEAIVLANQ